MSEQQPQTLEEWFTYFTEEKGADPDDVQDMLGFGWEPDEVGAKLLNDDLWVLEPALRMGKKLEGEEGVRQWEEAAEFMEGLAHWALHISNTENHAIVQLILDAAERAHEALDRVSERAREASR